MSTKAFYLGTLALAIAFLAGAALRKAPQHDFGVIHDDTLYFSTAKALANGEGFVMPSVPGEPDQTKYPILYPALLSVVWLVNPNFPENLELAWLLTILFGAAAVAISVPLARQLGAGRKESLALAAVFAINPYVKFWSDALVSDMVFYSFAIGAAVAAHLALEKRQKKEGWKQVWAATIALLWLATLTRTVGVSFVAGVVGVALLRRAWIPAAWALTAFAPVALKLAGFFGKAELPAVAASWEGFRNNLWYYTSYLDYWKVCVPNLNVFEHQISFTFVEILKHPAIAIFMVPAIGIVTPWMQILAVTISIGAFVGVVRRARQYGLHPLHVAGVAYLPIMLFWNYPLLIRFGIPFTVLLAAGAFDQVREIALRLRITFRNGPMADRVIGFAFAGAVMFLLAYTAQRSVWELPRRYELRQQQRAGFSEAKEEAYRWLKANTEPDAVVISYEDASLYLHAGRQGMRPVSMSTEAFFLQDMDVVTRDLEDLGDTAMALGAGYWLRAPDDFSTFDARKETEQSVDALLADLPVAFRSRDGKVEVIRLEGKRWAQLRQQSLAGKTSDRETPEPASD